MQSLNTCILMGNVGNPELRALPGGTQVLRFGLALDSDWTGQDGQRHERTDWADCYIVGDTAPRAAKWIVSGRRIVVEASYRADRRKGRDGSTRVYKSFRVERFHFAGARPQAQDAAQAVQLAFPGAEVTEEQGAYSSEDIPF